MNKLNMINGEKLRDVDIFLKEYGCLKIDYREHEDERYYLYAFSNNLPEWDFNNGELVGITTNIDFIEDLKEHIFTVKNGDFFCEECFRKKDIEKLSNSKDTKYWCWYIWKNTPIKVKKRIQNEILFSIPGMNWPKVKHAYDSKKSYIFYGVCSTHCMSNEEYKNNKEIKELKAKFQRIWELCITDEITNGGTEELLELFLCDHIDVIEDGMTLVESQYKVANGIIDIVAKDKNDVTCIIELKIVEDDKNLVWQSAYYPSCFDEIVRMITIAPNYSNRIYNALKNVNNVEMKVFGKGCNGFLEIKDFGIEEKFLEDKEIQLDDNGALEDAM